MRRRCCERWCSEKSPANRLWISCTGDNIAPRAGEKMEEETK
jgi:hypothetical protein